MGERIPRPHAVEMEQPSPKAELRIILVPLDGDEPISWEGGQRRRPNFFKLLWTRLTSRRRGREDQPPRATKGSSS